MHTDTYNLTRFTEAQNGVYPIALKELQEGCKRSHRMWYIFPQLNHIRYLYSKLKPLLL
ncbi:MAG: DUF1810 domain-containing protein [Bacteroides sp.]|nr:DUF1810 domain-containing protein [Bacteroides sp.]